MSYTYKELSFASSDGKNAVYAQMYIPTTPPRAVVQLAHGMIDYVGRYKELAEFFAENKIAFVGNDHLGHGATAYCDEDYGYFADNDGYRYAIDDLYRMNSVIKQAFPGVPVVMLGHSMGSFMARLYAVKYPTTIDAVIIHGTGGRNPLLAPGMILAKIIRALFGARHRSELINKLAFGSYNKNFPEEEGPDAWLTRDVARVASRPTDPYTNYKFTVSGYIDLFTMLGLSNETEWFMQFPKDMHTLIVSGDADPVGDYGRGVEFVYNNLCAVGAKYVDLKMYNGARHELFNETNREEVYSDLLEWIEGVI